MRKVFKVFWKKNFVPFWEININYTIENIPKPRDRIQTAIYKRIKTDEGKTWLMVDRKNICKTTNTKRYTITNRLHTVNTLYRVL